MTADAGRHRRLGRRLDQATAANRFDVSREVA
jgi:hypothetical protein